MRTQLYDEHLRLGAKMTEFAGWEMPLQYAGIAHEVEVVRTKVGLFDISHMGEFVISGPNALDLVQYVTTNDASALEVGKAQYTLMCDENGGVIDDLIVYRTGEEDYLLVVNASNVETDYEWIAAHNTFGCDLLNISDAALVAVQGPLAELLLEPLAEFDATALGRFHIAITEVAGVECFVARTGYTGEDGFEVLCTASEANALWNALLESGKPLGAEPIGLGARDVLRLEAAYSLHGHELTRETSPVAARLMWVVEPAKGDFIGRDAILRAKETGEKRTLVGIEAIDRCIPRHGCDVVTLNSIQGPSGMLNQVQHDAQVAHDAVVGTVTSGTFSPTLGKGIALAYIDKECSAVGTEVDVVMGARTCACRVVPTPFYRRQEVNK